MTETAGRRAGVRAASCPAGAAMNEHRRRPSRGICWARHIETARGAGKETQSAQELHPSSRPTGRTPSTGLALPRRYLGW